MNPTVRASVARPSGRRLRAEVVATARRMNALGINRGRAGNVSARRGGGFLITPSAVPYDAMAPSDLVAVDLDGSASGAYRPSTEWPFHRAIYAARPEVGAIVHAHSVFATALACVDLGIPAFHYMVAVAGGGDIRCARYATFGTEALARRVVRALEGRRACLMSRHGLIAVGASLDAALDLAVEIEWLAQVYWCVLQVGHPKLLSRSEMARVLDRFSDYRAGPPRLARG